MVVFALVAAAGCNNKKVDTREVEEWLEQRMTELGIDGATVACPDGVVAKVGREFTCTIGIEDQSYEMVVTILALGEKIDIDTRWKGGEAVQSRKLEQMSKADLSKDLGVEVVVECGEPLRFLDAASRVTCDLSAASIHGRLTFTLDEDLVVKSWVIDPNLLVARKLVAIVTPAVSTAVKTAVEVDCGVEPVFVRPADGIVWCEVESGGKKRKLQLTVDDELQVSAWKIVAS